MDEPTLVSILAVSRSIVSADLALVERSEAFRGPVKELAPIAAKTSVLCVTASTTVQYRHAQEHNTRAVSLVSAYASCFGCYRARGRRGVG